MGLLKTAAKTAVITSTATRVHGRAQRREQQAWAQQDQRAQQAAPSAPPPPPAPPAPAAPAGGDMAAKFALLTQLGELREAGLLNEHEFEAKKALILAG